MRFIKSNRTEEAEFRLIALKEATLMELKKELADAKEPHFDEIETQILQDTRDLINDSLSMEIDLFLTEINLLLSTVTLEIDIEIRRVLRNLLAELQINPSAPIHLQGIKRLLYGKEFESFLQICTSLSGKSADFCTQLSVRLFQRPKRIRIKTQKFLLGNINDITPNPQPSLWEFMRGELAKVLHELFNLLRTKDPVRAIRYLAEALELNHWPAYESVLEESEDSENDPDNPNLNSAQQEKPKGTAEELFLLGLQAFMGVGVKKNQALALQYFEYAANEGHAGAEMFYGLTYRIQNKNISDPIVTECLITAAGRGYTLAQTLVFIHSSEVLPNEFEKRKAMLNGLAAAKAGDARFQCFLGTLLSAGSDYSFLLGIYWLKRAAAQHNLQALEKLGELYSSKNEGLAAYWYRRAFIHGSVTAMESLRDLASGVNFAANYHYILATPFREDCSAILKLFSRDTSAFIHELGNDLLLNSIELFSIIERIRSSLTQDQFCQLLIKRAGDLKIDQLLGCVKLLDLINAKENGILEQCGELGENLFYHAKLDEKPFDRNTELRCFSAALFLLAKKSEIVKWHLARLLTHFGFNNPAQEKRQIGDLNAEEKRRFINIIAKHTFGTALIPLLETTWGEEKKSQVVTGLTTFERRDVQKNGHIKTQEKRPQGPY